MSSSPSHSCVGFLANFPNAALTVSAIPMFSILHRRSLHSFRDFPADVLVKRIRKNMFRIRSYARRERHSRSQFHLFSDLLSMSVTSAPEYARKSEHIIHLVRIIASSCRYDTDTSGFRLFRHYLWSGICHREND